MFTTIGPVHVGVPPADLFGLIDVRGFPGLFAAARLALDPVDAAGYRFRASAAKLALESASHALVAHLTEPVEERFKVLEAAQTLRQVMFAGGRLPLVAVDAEHSASTLF
jgi:hypothetical protein